MPGFTSETRMCRAGSNRASARAKSWANASTQKHVAQTTTNRGDRIAVNGRSAATESQDAATEFGRDERNGATHYVVAVNQLVSHNGRLKCLLRVGLGDAEFAELGGEIFGGGCGLDRFVD